MGAIRIEPARYSSEIDGLEPSRLVFSSRAGFLGSTEAGSEGSTLVLVAVIVDGRLGGTQAVGDVQAAALARFSVRGSTMFRAMVWTTVFRIPRRRAVYTNQRGEYPDPPWSAMKPTTRDTNH
jgi:hypothetical protein